MGLSIDGPRELHDRYRIDKGGKGTFDKVVAAAGLLRRHGAEFNTLTVINRANAQRPRDVYRFLKDIGSGFMQFIPLVERQDAEDHKTHDLEGPPQTTQMGGRVSPWSVPSTQWGEFLNGVWDEWIKEDVGKIYVNMFDVQLGLWAGMPSTMCVFAEECGLALAMEHNGDLYSCDHYVYPEYKLGNITKQSFGDMVQSQQQKILGPIKNPVSPDNANAATIALPATANAPSIVFSKMKTANPN